MPITNNQVLATLGQTAILRIGRIVADYRGRKGQILTQEKLGEAVGETRTTVAYLEEGRELPKIDIITSICERLEIPTNEWMAATHPFYKDGYIFHELACELVGRRVSLSDHAASDQLIALDRAEALFKDKMSVEQAHTHVNALLVFYGERPLSIEFFNRYLGSDAFHSNTHFLDKLRMFQSEAMRLYGNFRRAFTRMSRVADFKAEIAPLERRSLSHYSARSPFTGINLIPPNRLADLGYIAAQRITTQNKERLELSTALNQIATGIEKSGQHHLTTIASKQLSRIRTLLRKIESSIQLEANLFSELDPTTLREEAKRITPENSDVTRISRTQSEGLHNLGVYLSEPFMDVYIATSMREDADFQSVNSFVNRIMVHELIKPLNLRYFNPTQSWIDDRVSKGLVEALMLRRAAVTVYMAQKTDTFGKDSEASVALGQGKAVIVYVPRLYDSATKIDSQAVFSMNANELEGALSHFNFNLDDELDLREKARIYLKLSLERMTNEQFGGLLFDHWADFDLHAECRSVDNANLRSSLLYTIDTIGLATDRTAAGSMQVEFTTRKELTDKLVAIADKFESRAKLFRDTHPLALQVIVRSGVLNGILVTRSVGECAHLLQGVLENSLAFDVEFDESNYRLVERITHSTIRVVSRHRLLTFAFWSQYFDPENFSLPHYELPAATI